ncbi:UDP-N-acetylmuramoyl-L-alanyl-D-glutamate--2,6-diaminopimelate ligase [Candidatus Daviesbacteria bacterium]|nr:UDP-N-acetylmuramoyl-L-alanyl-D-glutamate--2,6-diaminopimelate ligase [Candidatus Daviesbacteria bacterium]
MHQIKKYLKALFPQWVINNFWHLPKAILANLVYGFPSKKLKVIGVTGTDGKTTTVNMIYCILKNAGKKVSMVSTINAEIAGKSYDTGFHVSSPDSFTVQSFAKKAKDHKDEFLILEVTSHALDQYRFWGINFDIGVITNITHDHLDYHKSWENYFLTKAKLIKGVRVAVINKDEKHFNRLSKFINPNSKILSFGFSPKADFNPKSFSLNLKLIGEYNILNGLAAAAVCASEQVSTSAIKSALPSFVNLKGRMEEIKNSKGIKIIIDFASTPNSLEQALKALRRLTKGKLISIFGSASERDFKKRPLMGQASAKYADITILTDEDPRFEDRYKIIDEIAAGVYKIKGKKNIKLFKQPDRQEAIKLGISLAKKGDLVGIFGKGHEKSISFKGQEIPWSDEEAVQKALNDR